MQIQVAKRRKRICVKHDLSSFRPSGRVSQPPMVGADLEHYLFRSSPKSLNQLGNGLPVPEAVPRPVPAKVNAPQDIPHNTHGASSIRRNVSSFCAKELILERTFLTPERAQSVSFLFDTLEAFQKAHLEMIYGEASNQRGDSSST
ncbi:unnamed protein product [Larinioides sclopetarius]|uniref:Uncharacterized protein n=1 Tax=Larinioides sclopetarius TaxID=280406 RepID=A0AAV1ZM47_9ARAC